MTQKFEDRATSLTGVWHGQYGYPVVTRAPVPFTALLVESPAFLGGSITERVGGGRTLYSTVSGHRSGHAVHFVKMYEANSGAYTTVTYQGVLSEDGLEIDGEWTATGWSGRFLMIRQPGVLARVGKRVAARV